MKKLFEKDEIWFAVLWIAVYVFGFSTADALSETVGIPKLFTIILGVGISLILYGFIRKNRLEKHCGLCLTKNSPKDFLYYIPLVFISSINLFGCTAAEKPFIETALFILSMVCVGFLEEIIFRGFLFKGMLCSIPKVAVLVSSLTFGMGHAINLLMGEPVPDTLLQLVYASAVGFCFTVVFLTSGSLLPCILSHIFVNATSIFAPETDFTGQIVLAAVQTVISISYGVWLLHKHKNNLQPSVWGSQG